MSTRDLDGVLHELDKFLQEILNRYGGGLTERDYMRNVGREDAVKDMRERVLDIRRRGGDDDADESASRAPRRARRGVSTETDDWGPTPGEPVPDPF